MKVLTDILVRYKGFSDCMLPLLKFVLLCWYHGILLVKLIYLDRKLLYLEVKKNRV